MIRNYVKKATAKLFAVLALKSVYFLMKGV